MAFGRTSRADRPRTLRKDRTGFNPFWVGLLVLIGVVIISYLGFTKDLPFSRGFEFKAVFPSANSIRLNSPVRIAGVNVGTVKKIEGQDGTNNAVITMEMKDTGLPIHKDAELKIRPRIFLEGNFFVDLEPGTPSAPTISDGDTIPVDQTATPVQLDQVLTSLQQDTRQEPADDAAGVRHGAEREADAAEDARQPRVDAGQDRGRGAELGDRLRRPGAARLGDRPDGAARARSPRTSRASSRASPASAASSRRRSASSASSSRTSTRRWPRSPPSRRRCASRSRCSARPSSTAYTAFGSLDEALPSVRAFSLALVPGIEQTQPTIDAVTPWIAGRAQARLPGAARRPARRPAAGDREPREGHRREHPAARAGRPAGACFSNQPKASAVHHPDRRRRSSHDGKFSTGKPNYQEFWYAVTGQAGEGQNIDGNGRYIRAQAGGGANLVGPERRHADERPAAVRQPDRHAAGHEARLAGRQAAAAEA